MGLYAELQNIPKVALFFLFFFPFPFLYFLYFWYSLCDLAVYKDSERSKKLWLTTMEFHEEECWGIGPKVFLEVIIILDHRTNYNLTNFL